MSSCTSLTVAPDWSDSAMSVTAIQGPGTVTTGASTQATVTVRNNNTGTGSGTIRLELNGSSIATKNFTIPGETTDTFSVPFVAPSSGGSFQLCAYSVNEGPA